MRISRVQAFLCDAGWRPWTFVKVETDDGLVGWGECSDSRNPHGIVGCVRDFEDAGDADRIVERAVVDRVAAERLADAEVIEMRGVDDDLVRRAADHAGDVARG